MLKYEDFLGKLQNSHTYARYISGVCPFEHHKTPALLVFKDGWFRCLGCNRNGSWEQLWNKLNGQNITIRTEKVTSWKGPSVEGDMGELCYQAHIDLMQFSSLQWYLQQRGLERRIEINELGYTEGWYSIPVRTREGDFITAVFRAAPHVQEATKMRYWCNHIPVPYYPDHRLVETTGHLFVVYGMLDALTLADLRFPVVTSTSGKDTFNPEWLEMYRKKVYIIPDKGEEDSAYELASNLGWRGKVLHLNFPDGIKDCNGYYEQGKGETLRTELLNQIRN